MKYTLSFLTFLLLIPTAFADMAPLVSYKKELVNKKYVLVMLYPAENSLNKDNPIGKMYPKSGLYLNDGSRDPIWTLDEPFQGQLFLSADGDFLANVVFPADRDGDGLRFFHKGKLIRSHKVLDLAHPGSVQDACPSCIWKSDVKFKEAEETIELESRDGRIWRFNLRTGEAESEAPFLHRDGLGVWVFAIIAIVALLMIVLASVSLGGFLWWRSWRQTAV